MKRKKLHICSTIPNTMSHKGLEYLARIAASASTGATLLEAGSLYGCTAWVLSKNAPSQANVFAIDPWEHDGFLKRFKINNLRVPDLSIHSFKAYTIECENLTAVQGYSPQAAEGLDLEGLEIVFEDAAHSYDVLKQNVEYFMPRLKPGGIICGDDYQSAFPGVIRCVNELANELGVRPQVSGQVWAIQKPGDDGNSDVYGKVGNLFESEIGVSVISEQGVEYVASPHCFTPNLFSPSKINRIKLFWNNLKSTNFEWEVKFDDGSTSGILQPAAELDLGNRVFAGIRVKLKDCGDNLSVGYQVASFGEDMDSKLGPSKEYFNGAWAEVEKGREVYALSVSLVDHELRSMRRKHSALISAGKKVGEELYGEAGKKIKSKPKN